MNQLTKSFLKIVINISLTALPVLHTGSVRAEGAEDSPASNEVFTLIEETAEQIPTATQGIRVYRDPQTGQLGPSPAGVVPPAMTISEQHMLSRSDQGLISRTLPSGGVAINLQGRYRNMFMATVGSDGQATVNCTITAVEAAAVVNAGQ